MKVELSKRQLSFLVAACYFAANRSFGMRLRPEFNKLARYLGQKHDEEESISLAETPRDAASSYQLSP